MSPWHWLLVIAVAVLLFGARRLPDAARSLGRSARILKSELNADRADGEPAAAGGNEQPTQPRSAQPEPAPVADTAERPDPPR